jgi:hypothetical protein
MSDISVMESWWFTRNSWKWITIKLWCDQIPGPYMLPQRLTGGTSATRNASLLRVRSSTDCVPHSTYRSRLWVGRESISRTHLLLTHTTSISVLKAVIFVIKIFNCSDIAAILAWHSLYKTRLRPLSMRIASLSTKNYRIWKHHYWFFAEVILR